MQNTFQKNPKNRLEPKLYLFQNYKNKNIIPIFVKHELNKTNLNYFMLRNVCTLNVHTLLFLRLGI